MKKVFDRGEERLIFLGKKANSTYWDQQWADKSFRTLAGRPPKRSMILEKTKKFVSVSDGPILEGGCGLARHVAALSRNGYECIGVDYAEATVDLVRMAAPELDVRIGDVRNLDFPDNFFAAYWSLGVIEHFWDGYNVIANEMKRVIMPGGYLFVTFPHMSFLRRMKHNLGKYEIETFDTEPNDFYQFALNYKRVVHDLEIRKFRLVERVPRDGLKGLKDEIQPLSNILQRLYDYQGRSLLIRGFRLSISRITAPISGNTILLVFRKT